MSDELYEVLAALMKDHKGDGPLVPVKNPRKALQTASKLAGITPPVTPGALRHFWSSRAMESDIPVHVIAAMRGDRDGGKTLLKTYAHLRDAHVREMVARLPGTVQRPVVPACQPRRSGRVTAVR
jgi:integrase